MKYIFLISLCLCCYDAGAQTYREELNELHATINRNKADTTTVNKLLRLSELYYLVGAGDSSLAYSDQARELSRKINYPLGIYLGLSQAGIVEEAMLHNYQAALRYYRQAADTMEKFRLQKDIPGFDEHAYGKVLNLYFYLGDFGPAMKMATERLRYFEQEKDEAKQAHYNSLTGFICLRQDKPGEAKKYYEKYLQYAKAKKDSLKLADAYNCLADVYLYEKSTQAAFEYLFTALDIYNSKNKTERIAYTSYKLATAYEQRGEHGDALRYVLKAIELDHTVPSNKYDLAAYYILAGNIYKKTGDDANAKHYLLQGLHTAQEIHHSEDIRDASKELMEVYGELGMYDSAYHYSVMHGLYKDSISNERIQREIEQIHTAYEVDNKNQEIALLNARNKSQRLVRNGVIILSLLFVAVSLLLYNRRALKQQNRLQAEMNKQRNELFNAVINAQDRERKRIAQDLHDGLGSILSAAKLKLSEQNEHAESMALLDEAATELRNISHNIMPATLAKVGPVAALRGLAESLSAGGLQVNVQAYNVTERWAEETELSAYRIILELVNNAVKHARASEINVQLVVHSSYLNISVEDNGVGFDQAKEGEKPKGIGLGNIQSRVDYLGGTMSIESSPGAGTLASVNIPLNKA